MLKKVFLLFLPVAFLASCNSVEESVEDNYLTSNDVELAKVYNRIDSISEVYTNENAETRGMWKLDSQVTRMADNAGRIAGRYAGKYIGGAIGSASANLLGTVAGYVVGRELGGIVGSVAASYAAHKYISTHTRGIVMVPSYKNITMIDKKVDLDSITIGDLHNLMVMDLLNNGDKYTKKDGSLDYSLLFEDCVVIAGKYGIDVSDKAYLGSIKPTVMSQTKAITLKAFDCEANNQTPLQFYNKTYLELKGICDISKEDYNMAVNLDEKLSDTYLKLDKDNLKKCELEINKTIYNSDLNDETKRELQSSNSIVANSTLLWREPIK